jgi:hypothetical protein
MSPPRTLWPEVRTCFPVDPSYWAFVWHFLASSVSWSADRMFVREPRSDLIRTSKRSAHIQFDSP